MALLDASGAALGSDNTSADAVVCLLASGVALGGSAFVGQGVALRLSSASFAGASLASWDYLVEAGAWFAGSAFATALGHRARTTGGGIVGHSAFLYGTLLPIQGDSFFSVAPVVDVHLPPIKAITMGPKTFRWLQLLQRGDLSVFICNGRNAVVPVRVAYRLAQVRLDGSRKYVGPRERTPVAGDIGEFYVAGRAGESGQPGQWVIEWLYQRTPQSQVQTTEMPFQVLDAAAVGDPREQLERKTKYGWS